MNDSITITSRDTHPRNITALKDHLKKYNWAVVLNSTSLDTNMETLDNVIQTELDYCTPVKSRKKSPSRN